MKAHVAMRYALAAMALAICSVQVTQPAIQKIKRVSKQVDDGQIWTVFIYKMNGANKGDLVSSSSFKRNTDGFRPDKLHFDFGQNNNIANQIEIYKGKGELFRDEDFVHQQTIQPFPQQRNLSLTLTKDGTVIGLPKPKSTIPVRENKPIKVSVPDGSWTVISGELLTADRMQDMHAAEPFILDRINNVKKGKNHTLKVYTERPASIAAKKAGVTTYVVTILEDLPDIIKSGALEINENGYAHAKNARAQRSEF